jgi:tetrahydromethanopterin S-methyltransferase subunit E
MSGQNVTFAGGVPASHPARALTTWSYAVNLAYLVWLPVMFVAGYWVYSWFGLEPGMDTLSSAGFLGWLATLGFGLVTTLPSWCGAWLAVRARRVGGHMAAVVALVLNLLLAVGYTLVVLVGGL